MKAKEKAVTLSLTMSLVEWRVLAHAAYDIGSDQQYSYDVGRRKAAMAAYAVLDKALCEVDPTRD